MPALLILLTATMASAAPLPAPPPPASEAIRALHQRVVRVQAIARRIAIANRAACPETKPDYGFTSASPNMAAAPEVRAAWASALGIGTGSTIISVLPDSPAAKAGLTVGDAVLAVNGVPWSLDPVEQTAFRAASATGTKAPSLTLTIGHDQTRRDVAMTADQACAADFVLTQNNRVNASAQDRTVVIDGGLERLLADDAELAFVIAHETAHIILGHSAPSQKAAIRDKTRRSAMEQAADALGLRLMWRAGYPPEAAASAHPRIADAGRGPISRLLDIHGPYMSTRERTEFLHAQAAQTRSELSVP